MNLPHSTQLNIGYFSKLFDNTSNCYKFFWFKAILTKLEEGQVRMTFDELINEMIADAWYMVNEYHLRLGPSDTTDNLEEAVKYLAQITQFKSSEERSKIIKAIEDSSDKKLHKHKTDLTLNVPYRLQAPFYDSIDLQGKWNKDKTILTETINHQERLMYYFGMANGLKTEIVVEQRWIDYILTNKDIIKGWLELNLIHYLQRRNPGVPGIADKLYAPRERKLEKAKKYWKAVISYTDVRNIYSGDIMSESGVSIDHFIPWSYVAHDELWNLIPTTRSINSSKSNNLPDWDMYFLELAETEFKARQAVASNESIYALQKAAMKEHVNSEEIKRSLYLDDITKAEFCERLDHIIRPSYESALNSGFQIWRYEQHN